MPTYLASGPRDAPDSTSASPPRAAAPSPAYSAGRRICAGSAATGSVAGQYTAAAAKANPQDPMHRGLRRQTKSFSKSRTLVVPPKLGKVRIDGSREARGDPQAGEDDDGDHGRDPGVMPKQPHHRDRGQRHDRQQRGDTLLRARCCSRHATTPNPNLKVDADRKSAPSHSGIAFIPTLPSNHNMVNNQPPTEVR